MCQTQEIKEEKNTKTKCWSEIKNKTISCQTFIMRALYIKFKAILLGGGKIHRSDERMMYAFFLILVFGVTSLISLILLNIYANNNLDKGESFGQFGDFLGGVLNPIFTLMTFFGVIVTIALQKIELRAAREEYKKSADALSTQAIENTFFNMLDLHHGIVEKLSFPSTAFAFDSTKLSGHAAQLIQYFSLKGEKASGAASFSSLLMIIKDNSDTINDTREIYKFFQDEHNYLFGHYFRNLYQIMKFVDSSKSIDFTEKKKYMSILRAQLSTNETTVLYLNCLEQMVDDGKFRTLLKTYQMLEHMPIICTRNAKNIMEYKPSNFDFIIADEKSIRPFLSFNGLDNGAFGKKKLYFPEK
ncbi:putative phage abortive infection protein [Aeromonas hydrophila]|uniref:putative phage abortive infection protein n=1 Tax=Aeromonas hydrophila TaxID=644 RepID=UPI0021E6C965|nr:putative phage abortive infection protein [Aeromonas hydrophila]MCV3276779.1 putative phage abortive infection protein [Aeromonas hydrophila]